MQDKALYLRYRYLIKKHIERYQSVTEGKRLFNDFNIYEMMGDEEMLHLTFIRGLDFMKNVKSKKWNEEALRIQKELGLSELNPEERMNREL